MCDACNHFETDDWVRARLHPIVQGDSPDDIGRRHWPRKPEILA